MLAQRIAALAASSYARTIRGILVSMSGRAARRGHEIAPRRRLQVLGAIVAGTLAGFLVAAVVRRARQGCRLRGSGAASADTDERPVTIEQAAAGATSGVAAEPTATGATPAVAEQTAVAAEQTAAVAEQTAAASNDEPAAGPGVDLPEEPAYAFEPEAILDLPEALRPPVTPATVPAPEGVEEGEPELAAVR